MVSQSHQIVKLSSHQWDEMQSPPNSQMKDMSHSGLGVLLSQFGFWITLLTERITFLSVFHFLHVPLGVLRSFIVSNRPVLHAFGGLTQSILKSALRKETSSKESP